MLKKITVADRRDMLIAELRKMEGDPRQGGVPFLKAGVNSHNLCALGVVCKLWAESIPWQGKITPVSAIGPIYEAAAKLVGCSDEGRAIYRINDQCETYPEVADKLEKLFAGLPVGG